MARLSAAVNFLQSLPLAAKLRGADFDASAGKCGQEDANRLAGPLSSGRMACGRRRNIIAFRLPTRSSRASRSRHVTIVIVVTMAIAAANGLEALLGRCLGLEGADFLARSDHTVDAAE